MTLTGGDFVQTIHHVKKTIVFYLDSPYVPPGVILCFTSYFSEEFYFEQQIELQKSCDDIQTGGNHFILGNSDLKRVKYAKTSLLKE